VKIRVREVKIRTPHRVIARRNLPKFGEAQEGELNVTIISPDFVRLEHPDDLSTQEDDSAALGGTLKDFIAKMGERATEREHDLAGYENSFSGPAEEGPISRSSSNTYVPPGMRGGPAGGGPGRMDRMGGGGGGVDDASTENTIKVSNLTKSVTDEDLKELFGRFGSIYRVSLPKSEKMLPNGVVIREPKGFAYVAYYQRRDAEAAFEKLQGHGYDHLILKLEWARPHKEGPPDGGGNGDRFRSGYGQKLAQDTTESVMYASNLTGNR
jgi:hypothetical protein